MILRTVVFLLRRRERRPKRPWLVTAVACVIAFALYLPLLLVEIHLHRALG